jgi:hypothetical protein
MKTNIHLSTVELLEMSLARDDVSHVISNDQKMKTNIHLATVELLEIQMLSVEMTSHM